MAGIVVSMTPPMVLMSAVMAVVVTTAALTARAALGGRGGSATFRARPVVLVPVAPPSRSVLNTVVVILAGGGGAVIGAWSRRRRVVARENTLSGRRVLEVNAAAGVGLLILACRGQNLVMELPLGADLAPIHVDVYVRVLGRHIAPETMFRFGFEVVDQSALITRGEGTVR